MKAPAATGAGLRKCVKEQKSMGVMMQGHTIAEALPGLIPRPDHSWQSASFDYTS